MTEKATAVWFQLRNCITCLTDKMRTAKGLLAAHLLARSPGHWSRCPRRRSRLGSGLELLSNFLLSMPIAGLCKPVQRIVERVGVGALEGEAVGDVARR